MKVTEKVAKEVSDRMKEKNLSTHDVSRNSGNSISNGSVWNIINKRVNDIKEETFEALAKGLLFSKTELLERLEESEEFTHKNLKELFIEADKLSESDVAEMEPIWQMVKLEIRRRLKQESNSSDKNLSKTVNRNKENTKKVKVKLSDLKAVEIAETEVDEAKSDVG